jgi:DNA-binding response OmpR family regulator
MHMSSQPAYLVIHADLVVDFLRHGLWYQDRFIPMPPIPFRILRQLVEQANTIVPIEALLHAGWPDEVRGREDLYPQIHYLRTLLEVNVRHPQVLITRWRDGYWLRMDGPGWFWWDHPEIRLHWAKDIHLGHRKTVVLF